MESDRSILEHFSVENVSGIAQNYFWEGLYAVDTSA